MINLWKFLPFKAVDVAVGLTKLLTGAQATFKSGLTEEKQTIFFANHSSNMDTIILWSALPAKIRRKTRPVAALDYWSKPGLRQHIATKELNVVFVDRKKQNPDIDPLEPLRQALKEGYSLIIFPEGQRNKTIIPQEFKSGIFRLHKEFPHVDLIPVYLENVAKTFPKGAHFPLPVICKAHFGNPFICLDLKDGTQMDEKTHKSLFLEKARQAVLDLMPSYIDKTILLWQEKQRLEEEAKNKTSMEEKNVAEQIIQSDVMQSEVLTNLNKDLKEPQ